MGGFFSKVVNFIDTFLDESEAVHTERFNEFNDFIRPIRFIAKKRWDYYTGWTNPNTIWGGPQDHVSSQIYRNEEATHQLVHKAEKPYTRDEQMVDALILFFVPVYCNMIRKIIQRASSVTDSSQISNSISIDVLDSRNLIQNIVRHNNKHFKSQCDVNRAGGEQLDAMSEIIFAFSLNDLRLHKDAISFGRGYNTTIEFRKAKQLKKNYRMHSHRIIDDFLLSPYKYVGGFGIYLF